MKKNYLLLILMTLSFTCFSQTIAIPDANFKARLLGAGNVATGATGTTFGVGADTNNNGEIEVSEALLVTGLDLGTPPSTTTGNILSLEGLQYFTNLKYLKCSGNQIGGNLDVSMMPALQTLDCGYNQITNLTVTGLTALRTIRADDNNLSSLSLENLPALKHLYLTSNNFTSLDVTMLPALEYLQCDYNQITQLTVANMTSLKSIVAEHNLLTSIDFTGLSDDFFDLVADYNLFETIDLSPLTGLNILHLDHNPLAEIILQNKPQLQVISIEHTPITTLDCSGTGVRQLSCGYNPNLTSINVKNDYVSTTNSTIGFYGFRFESLPSLVSVCIDNGEQDALNFTNYNSGGNAVVYTGQNCTTALGTDETATTAFVVYPNPFSNELSIAAAAEISDITILDYNGRIISRPAFNMNNGSAKISLEAGIQNGIYILKATTTEGRQIIQKIIKE